jgi:hypothetical protein
VTPVEVGPYETGGDNLAGDDDLHAERSVLTSSRRSNGLLRAA